MFHDVFIFTSTPEAPPGVAIWNGKPLGESPEGNIYYSSFKKDAETYYTNDFIILEDNKQRIIAKIIDLLQTKSKAMKLYGQWFYTWENLEQIGGNFNSYAEKLNRRKHVLKVDIEKNSKELFVSFDTMYFNISTVIGKCYVKYLKHRDLHNHLEWLKYPSNYFYSFGYNKQIHRFYNIPISLLSKLNHSVDKNNILSPDNYKITQDSGNGYSMNSSDEDFNEKKSRKQRKKGTKSRKRNTKKKRKTK